MSLAFSLVTDSGRSLFGTVQQVLANGTLANVWSVTAGLWQVNPTTADRTITITEGTGINSGTYTGGTGTLTGYTGFVLKRIHDTALSNKTIGISLAYLNAGVEQRVTNSGDLTALPADIRTYLNSNPVPASNMRGTDNALLAASYTAPDNAGIGNTLTQATTAATQATSAASSAAAAALYGQGLDTRLTTARAIKLDNLDATVSSRSTLTAPQVRTELNANPVPASNMRGTDNALLAASYTAPDNSGIANTLSQATTAATNSTTLIGRLTATRAGYLDNLSGGAVATQSSVTGIANNVAVTLVGPGQFTIPASSSTVYVVDVLVQDATGAMEAPDSTPTITCANVAGADRSANLGAVSTVGTGHYRAQYTVSSVHATEILIIRASVTEGGNALVRTLVIPAVTEAAVGGSGSFTSTDRSRLDAIWGKLPSKAYLTGTAASDGDINLAEMDGSRDPFKADVSLLATAASIVALPTDVRTYLNSNPVPASNMRGTDNALLAASYVAPDNAGISTAAAQATTAATQATTAATQASNAAATSTTLSTRLTAPRAANLDNLDAAISTVSTFDYTTDTVLVNPTGLATSAQAAAIKAKTDLIGASVAAVSDIPTASQIATQVDTTLTTNHPGNWAAGGDATLAKQDQILAAVAGIVPSPPSIYQVASARRWNLYGDGEDNYATNVITLPSGGSVVLAMDFSRILNPGTGVSSVSSVTDLSGNNLVPTGLLPSQDRRAAHFTCAGMTAGSRYELKVVIQTTDGQTISGRGRLRIES
jgi:hypothetical protein